MIWLAGGMLLAVGALLCGASGVGVSEDLVTARILSLIGTAMITVGALLWRAA